MVVHDKDCTWCKHRIVIKEKKGNHDLELCKFTNEILPLPAACKGDSRIRYCERFQQENCSCNSCTNSGLHS